MRKESLVAVVSLVLGITLILILFVLNLSRSAQSDSVAGLLQRLPPRLGGLPRVRVMEGEEALRALAALHRTTAGVSWAAMAHYEQGAAEATVWIGGAESAAAAGELLARMTAGIRRGGTKFTGLRPLTRGGREVFAVSGLGQTHYYFAAGPAVFWVSADPAAAEVVLAAVLQATGRGEAR